ncbi:MAG: hypothetical protein IKF45_01890 [Lachnospiraceae bacterium]|nr:hypothetical protein [Blautia sp.]MBR2562293.1 hypothetical protein [Eubacterium sp.]MBR2995439.1 hypothetical protein [Lachnospiraceae bacterium]
MTRNDICLALERASGGQAFITVSQLTKAMGRSDPKKVKAAYLSDLEAVGGKYYLIREVADVLKKQCRA